MNKKSSLLRSEHIAGYVMISPIILGFVFLLFLPLLYEVYLSFTDATLSLQKPNFIGWQNFKALFTTDKVFRQAGKNTLVYTLGLVPFNIITALLLACLLNQKYRGVGIFRTLLFMPNITPIVVWAIVWKAILATDVGVLNSFLGRFGIEGPAWLYDLKLTMPVVIVNSIMKGVGMNMVIFLSALKSVPDVYYEASRIDGASAIQVFRKVTVPLLSPTIFMVFIMTIIGALKSFSLIYTLTGGGPARSTMLLVNYIFEKGFKQLKFGPAAAISIILFLIMLVFTVIQWVMRKRLVYAEE